MERLSWINLGGCKYNPTCPYERGAEGDLTTGQEGDRKPKARYRDTGCEDEGRTHGPGMWVTSGSSKSRRGHPSQSLQGEPALLTAPLLPGKTVFRFLTSRTVREYICFKPLPCGNLL